MANISIVVDRPIADGYKLKFRTPCDSTVIEGLEVKYPVKNGVGSAIKKFVFKDAHGTELSGVGNLFVSGVMIEVLLDVTHGVAYIQNADTNSYVESVKGEVQRLEESQRQFLSVAGKAVEECERATAEAVEEYERIQAGLAGKTTENGGEIFNDYENNQAEGENTHAEGDGTRAGAMAFKILSIDDVACGYYLDDTTGLEAGMTYSCQLDSNYYNCGTIQTVAGNLVTVDSIPSLNMSEYDHNSIHGSFLWIADRPDLGTTNILGLAAHAEGYNTLASFVSAHAEGTDTKALGKYSHAEGRETVALFGGHAEGIRTKAQGHYSHAEGLETVAAGLYSHTEGRSNQATGAQSHAEGLDTRAIGDNSHAENYRSYATGNYSHAEGNNTKAVGEASHTEGYGTAANGPSSHAEGDSSIVTAGTAGHAEGIQCTVSNHAGHAEGYKTTASGIRAHAEGQATTAQAEASHAEGQDTLANGLAAHAEGKKTKASGRASHAEGESTRAIADYSHAGGLGTVATKAAQTVIGQYNEQNDKALLLIGNGTDDTARKNALVVYDETMYINNKRLATIDEVVTPNSLENTHPARFKLLRADPMTYWQYALDDRVDTATIPDIDKYVMLSATIRHYNSSTGYNDHPIFFYRSPVKSLNAKEGHTIFFYGRMMPESVTIYDYTAELFVDVSSGNPVVTCVYISNMGEPATTDLDKGVQILNIIGLC